MRRVIVSSLGNDPGVAFVGSSPTRGDTNYTGLVLPPEPTTSQATRVLVQCCAMGVPHNAVAYVRSMRQLLSVGWEREVGQGLFVPFELLLPSHMPLFRFTDGNVSWHLQKTGPGIPPRSATAGQPPSWSRTLQSIGPAILYDTLPPSLGGPGYTPLNGGMPPGNPLLGTIHDVRYPWNVPAGSWPELNIKVEGPGTIALYASVHQTNPAERLQPIVDAPLPVTTTDVLSQIVVEGIQNARYWRVGGELVVDIEETPK